MRKYPQRLLALSLGLSVAFAGSEAWLRATDSIPRQQNSRRAFHDHHPRLGWVGSKNYVARFRRDGFDGLTAFDEDGFRRVEVPFEGPPDAPLVAFLGDSYTWGYGVSQGEVFADHLQRALGQRARVANFGITGFSTGQEWILLEDIVLPRAPRIVTVVFCPNDLLDNTDSWGGRRPWFQLVDGVVQRENLPVERKITGPLYAFARRSLAYTALRYRLNVLAERFRSSHAAPPRDHMASPAGDTRELWELQLAILREMRDQCRAAAPPVELRVAYAPGLANLRGDDALPQELGRVCAQLEIPYFDPCDAFRQAWADAHDSGSAGQPLLFPLDTHWAQAGHALFARLLFEHFDGPGGD